MSMSIEEALEVLGVDAEAEKKVVRRAYLKLVKKHRPERDPEGFARAREAWDVWQELIIYHRFSEWQFEPDPDPAPRPDSTPSKEKSAPDSPANPNANANPNAKTHPDPPEPAEWKVLQDDAANSPQQEPQTPSPSPPPSPPPSTDDASWQVLGEDDTAEWANLDDDQEEKAPHSDEVDGDEVDDEEEDDEPWDDEDDDPEDDPYYQAAVAADALDEAWDESDKSAFLTHLPTWLACDEAHNAANLTNVIFQLHAFGEHARAVQVRHFADEWMERNGGEVKQLNSFTAVFWRMSREMDDVASLFGAEALRALADGVILADPSAEEVAFKINKWARDNPDEGIAAYSTVQDAAPTLWAFVEKPLDEALKGIIGTAPSEEEGESGCLSGALGWIGIIVAIQAIRACMRLIE